MIIINDPYLPCFNCDYFELYSLLPKTTLFHSIKVTCGKDACFLSSARGKNELKVSIICVLDKDG